MKRKGFLFERLTDLENIKLAEKKAKRGKSRQKAIKKHNENWERNILEIQEELINKTYKTSEYYVFKLYEPKERIISRLPFKDRIIHHAVMNILEPILVPSLISQTYSCIKGRGIHKCLRDVKLALKDKTRTTYCLKIDIKKFYQNTDKEILKSQLRKKIKDKDFLWLLDEIIDSHQNGIPLGSLTSQFFANFYLNGFDHELKQNSGIKYYFRYADDIVILHHDKQFLHNLVDKIVNFLEKNLKLKLSKHRIFPVKLGIDFVGYKIFPEYVLLRKSIKKRFINMIKKYPNNSSIMSYKGWITHCNGNNLWRKYTSKY